MKQIIFGIRFTGLALTILPAIFVFAGLMPFQTHKLLMTIGCILWFVPVLFPRAKANES